MDPVRRTCDFLDSLAEGHGLHQRLDQGGRLGPDEVRAEQSFSRRVADHLHTVTLVVQRPTVGHPRVFMHVADVVNAGSVQLGLGEPNRGDFRLAEDALRHEPFVLGLQLAPVAFGQQVLFDQPGLPVRQVLEHDR